MMTTSGEVVKRGTAVFVAIAGLVLSGGARAATISLPNLQDRNNTSAFVLDFGQFGGVSSANISASYIRLDLDPAAGTARFATYVQFVEPLTLPDGSSTGNITVVIERPSAGTFDRATGTFAIPDDEYAIYFDGDLSAFGITSPFRLPSPSGGEVDFATVSTGSTRMEWRGDAALPSPFQPGQVIPFSYACSVRGTFALQSGATWITRTEPAGNIVDARQPHPANDASEWQGIDYVDLTFNAPLVTPVTAAQVVLTEFGGDGIAPEVRSVDMLDERTARAWLSEPLEPGSWTTVSVPSLDLGETGTCLGALPGDVDGNGVANVHDFSRLFHHARGFGGSLASHQCDMNRDGSCNVQDLHHLLSILNGNAGFDRWINTRIGSSPCRD